MEVMLSESKQILRKEQNCSWTSSNHTQLIYDFSEGSPRFRLICTSPENLDADQRMGLSQLNLPGFTIPTTGELRELETLDRYLSQALSIPLNDGPGGRKSLKCIDDNQFVLTLDFALKLLNVHERVSCGVPCIVKGETGVSKTALTRMYCILVNSRQHSIAFASTFSDLESMLNELVTRFPTVAQDDSLGVLERIHKFLEPSSQHSAEEASQAVHDLIEEACFKRSALFEPIPPSLMDDSDEGGTADLLAWFSESNLEPMFFDVNVHGSLTADDLQSKFDEVRHVAQKLSHMENVKVIVFLDEINTSSVLGLLKELIVDRSLNGDLLEENIVLIAACNPPCQSTLLQSKTSREIDLGREWASGHYQVKRLPFSLEMITWDYGSLNIEQEKEFIHQRIVMADEQIPDIDARGMTEMISRSHELIRELAKGHIRESILKEMAHKSDVDNESRLRARSVVSLRDIQRVFHLFNFFLHEFALGPQLIGESDDKLRRAMLLSVACVYYLRLDAASRKTFLRDLKSLPSEQYQDCHLKEALETPIDALMEHTEIPVGIALTSGLKENLFMTLVCTLSRTPLMIIGPPGCSKTLAVNTVTDNACGEESPGLLYRKLARIQPFHYQCSKSSTSNEVASVFDRAIQRQSKVNRAKQQCLVFMDEAGLPEEEKESLKVLHYLLEGHMSAAPEVGFVCITNHILDAAKSNRCVCLLRPEPNKDELMCIAKGVLCQKHRGDESNIELICFDNKLMRTSEEFCADLCCCYFSLIQNKDKFSWFVHFFGLRGFIHLIMYVRRSAALMNSVLHVSVEVVVQALERNFNGVDDEKLSNICALFLQSFLRDKDCTKECLNQHRRHPMEVLHHALMDNSDHDSRYNLPRYKMIIDDTNDDSVMRLLEMAGILNSSHSFYQLSGMKEGSETEQLNLVSRVKFAAQQGDKTVVMSQVEEISECFYDLFNQHFKEFKKDGETSYFANIAIGGISRPCIIHPRFQCIVHVQSDQLGEMPSPYLNRFEKFQLTIDDILSWQLSRLPLGMKVMMGAALSKCEELLTHLGDESIWATRPHETLKSLFIKMVRPTGSAEPIFSPCQDHNSPRRLICSGVLDFLQSSLVVEGMSVEDVEQSLVTSSSELRGIEAIELKKVLGMETSLDQSQLEKSLGHLASDASRDSPLSRCLDLIVRVLITRHAVFQLLKVAKPEAIYLQRHCLPKEMLRKYFGGQEHFHLKSFISTLTRSSSLAYAPQVCQRYMLSVRSDLCPHSLPSWCGDDRNDARTQALFKAKVESIVHEHPSDIEIHHLDMMKSESSVRGAINSWATTEEISCLMLVADMQLQSSPKLVNFVRAHIERVKLSSMKKFFLLLHHPLSCETPSYPALFLGTWQCVYLDGIGHQGVPSSHLSINSVFEAACFDDCSLRADSMLDALLPKALQYVASQVSFYTRSSQPQSVNRDMEFTERLVKLEGILKSPIKGESLGRIICQQYLNMWRQEAIQEMLQRSAHGLMSGATHLSLSSAVRSTFQHTFNKFLANRIIDINMGSNLDILDDQLDLETDEIFSLVLSSLPDIPLTELLLQRDIYRPLNPLPLEKANSETLVFFPFYHHLSSFIAMILDKATAEMSSTDPVSLLEGVEQVMVSLLECPASFPIDEPMVRALRDVIGAVRASPELFDKYLAHMLLWEFGIRNSTQAKRWILNKINRVEDRCRRNIIFLHAITRVNVTGIIRMYSWDFISDPIGVDEGNFEGPQFVGAVLDHYKTLFPSNFDGSQEWTNSFLIFMQSIPTMIEDGTLIDDVTIVSTLRQLVFLSVMIMVKAPETTIADMANRISTGNKYTMSDFIQLLDDFAADDDVATWPADAREKLLRIFFSPKWLQSVADIDFADANFLISLIKGELFEHQTEHQMAVVHLRNLLQYGPNNNNDAPHQLTPTKCFSQPIASLICRNLSCKSISCFEESGERRRKSMSHYLPSWLRNDGQAVANNAIDDDISWFFQDYKNGFDCPLADVVFDVMLGLLVAKVQSRNCSSNQLLLLFEQVIRKERNVTHREQVRRARQALHLNGEEAMSFVGSCLGAIEASVLLVCLVCKIAEEIGATASQALVFSGPGSNSAERVLGSIMSCTHNWPELFFSVILRLSGEAHLASLLNEGGALNRFQWCTPWRQGISSLQHNIVQEMTAARARLREAEEDTANLSEHFMACPHCRGLFGVDQRNCGQFTCGSDSHGVNGLPAVGGRAVREAHGCRRAFGINQALPYNQSNQYATDQAVLRELRDDFEQKRRAFDAFNVGAEMWRRADNFLVPYMAFSTQKVSADSMRIFPSVALVEFMPEAGNDPSTKLLRSVLHHLPKLEHLHYLPDMIETKDISMNLKIGDVMDEHLLSGRFGTVDGAHLNKVWSRVAEGINAFLSANDCVVLWNCEEVAVPFDDINSASLISILSEMEDPSEGNDYLFLIINELVLRYNNFVKSMVTITVGACEDVDQRTGEIHPRTLLRQSKGSVNMIGALSSTEKVVGSLIESYWIKDERSFNVEGLVKAIGYDIGILSQLQPIKSPLSSLREKFIFRALILNAERDEATDAACFCSSDGLYFARSEDLQLYEEVNDRAKAAGFVHEDTTIRHTMLITFQTFSHEDWTSLLEGLRNTLGHLQLSDFLHTGKQFGPALKLCGVTNAGFPSLDDSQSRLLNCITKTDVVEVISVCGEQLSSEAYRFAGLSNRIAEPLAKDSKDSIREGIAKLLKSKSGSEVREQIDSFCDDVLEFYCNRLILPSSESSNEGLHSFLKSNNCCDEEMNAIFAVIPNDATIRNYVDVQKVLYQAKLKLLFESKESSPTSNDSNPPVSNRSKYSKWKWVGKTADTSFERYQWKAFGNLWFEDALMKAGIDAEVTEAEGEKAESLSESKEKKEDEQATESPGKDDEGLPESEVEEVVDSITSPRIEDTPTERDAPVRADALEMGESKNSKIGRISAKNMMIYSSAAVVLLIYALVVLGSFLF